MLKKVLNISFFILMCFAYLNTFSAGEKVQDVFIDIKSDYKYLNELQSFYDKGVITIDETKKFNPYQLLKRDEFVGISTEIGCKKCIKPNTQADLLSKYGLNYESPFFDLTKENKFFFCIAESNKLDVVKGYNIGYKCTDGTTDPNKNPFCVNNNITLEESLAVLFRNSSVFSIEENKDIINKIQFGVITENLANDVKPKNIDGSPYSFYGYFQKALSINYTEYDIYGNPVKYSLVSKDSKGNLNPKKYISKEEFLKMAYLIGNINSCNYSNNSNQNNYSLWGNLKIYDKSCDETKTNCTSSSLQDNSGIYDFKADFGTVCDKGISSVTWEFLNLDTKEIQSVKGAYLNDYKLQKGTIQIKSFLEDKCGNKTVLQTQIYNNLNNSFSSDISLKSISGNGPYKVDFESITNGCNNNCTFSWDFGDGKTSTSPNPTNNYTKDGVYKVTLTTTNGNGDKTISIKNIDTTKKNTFSSDILLKGISGNGPYKVDFGTITSGCDNNCTFNWDFGDGKTSTLPNPTNSYTKDGAYKVTLITTDKNGNKISSVINIDTTKKNTFSSDILLKSISGNGPYKVDFSSITNGCNNDCTFSWDFGDGKTSTSPNPTNSYTKDGTYKVTLVTTDKSGNKTTSTLNLETSKNNSLSSDILLKSISGNGPYKVDFGSVTTGCNNDCTFSWDFGDGKTSTSPNPTNNYTKDGIYKVTLITTDKSGNKTTSTLNLETSQKTLIPSGISANISLSSLSGNGPFKADFTSIITGCDSSCNLLWNFGDGNTSTGANPTNYYKTDGTYKVELTIFDKDGKKTTASMILNTGDIKNASIDTDGDGVTDDKDKCKMVIGVKENNGCPILDTSCTKDSDCKSGFFCNLQTKTCQVKTDSSLIGSCLYPENGSSIFGNMICDKCPCDYELDFISSLRKCDVVMPAIVSKDGKDVFSAGAYFQYK